MNQLIICLVILIVLLIIIHTISSSNHKTRTETTMFTEEEDFRDDTLDKLLKFLYNTALHYSKEQEIEGNVYTSHHSSTSFDNFKKIKNIGKLVSTSKNFLEVGFNAGHSCMSVLHYNPNIKNVLIFDINHHKYTEPIYNTIKDMKQHQNVNFNFIKGDSTQTIPNFETTIKYDFIHIDGGHSYQVAKDDIENCRKFASDQHILLIDDCSLHSTDTCLEKAVHECIENKIIRIIHLPYKLFEADHIVAKYIL